MYYLSILAAAIVAFSVARLIVTCCGKISRRQLRAFVFWCVLLPGVIGVCVAFFLYSAGNDSYLLSEPSYVAWLVAFLGFTLLSFFVFGLSGLRFDQVRGASKAQFWSIRRSLLVFLASVALLSAVLIAYDWQLKAELTALKEQAWESWQSQKSQTPEPNLAEQRLAPIRVVADQLDAFPEALFEKHLREIDPSDLQFTRLDEELSQAFALIRADLKEIDSLVRSLGSNSRDTWLEDPADRQRLKRLLFLFTIETLNRSQRGEWADAIEDQKNLRQFALAFAQSPSFSWSQLGTYAFALHCDSMERLLILSPDIGTAELSKLIDESIAIRSVHPEVLAATGAFFIEDTCNFYLGMIDDDAAVNDPIFAQLESLPESARGLLFAHLRFRRARDEMNAIRQSSQVFDQFARRFQDPDVTSEWLMIRREENWVQGHLARFDPRDIIIYRVNQLHGRRQVLNCAIAATLFHRQMGRYPENIQNLIPQHLSGPPIDLDSGQQIQLHPFQDGMIICGSRDYDRIKYRSGSNFDREFADSLSSAIFLGPAYQQFFGGRNDSEVSEADSVLSLE